MSTESTSDTNVILNRGVGEGASARTSENNWLGVVALVTGLLGMSLLAVIFGAIGLKSAKAGKATNRGMALAGTILGAVGLAIAAAVVTTLLALNANAQNHVRDEQLRELAMRDAEAIFYAVPSAAKKMCNERPTACTGLRIDLNHIHVSSRQDTQNYVMTLGFSSEYESIGVTKSFDTDTTVSVAVYRNLVDDPDLSFGVDIVVECVEVSAVGYPNVGAHYRAESGAGPGNCPQ